MTWGPEYRSVFATVPRPCPWRCNNHPTSSLDPQRVEAQQTTTAHMPSSHTPDRQMRILSGNGKLSTRGIFNPYLGANHFNVAGLQGSTVCTCPSTDWFLGGEGDREEEKERRETSSSSVHLLRATRKPILFLSKIGRTWVSPVRTQSTTPPGTASVDHLEACTRPLWIILHRVIG